jgi:hypothetical protein
VFKSFLIGLLLSVSLLVSAFAQQTEAGFQKEITYGINFNTDGGIIGGGAFRVANVKSEKWLHFWGVDVVEVKHPKENRLLGQGGDVFIWGKTNYLFVIRPEYGREYVFFRKAPESGVEVNGILGAGPSLGLLVPYYIDYDINGSSQGQGVPANIQRVRYDPTGAHKDINNIFGSAGFLTGLNETDLNIGAHIKAGLSFEYGRYQESITGIETGFLLEAYSKKLTMIPEAQNYQVFSSVYLTLYYGRRK